MKDSRFEETLLHNDVSNFTEDDITDTYESVISDLDKIPVYENARDSFHVENEVAKSIINIQAIDFPAACFERNDRQLQDVRLIKIPMAKSNQEKRPKIASKFVPFDQTSADADTHKSFGSKIPFGIIFIVLILCVIFNKRMHDTDILNRFKLDCLTVKSVFDLRIFSYSLVHMNFGHLIPNLMLLILFGSIVEIKLGTLNLLISYFPMCYLVGLGWYYRKVNLIGQCSTNQSSVIGSSGAVYALMTIAFLDCFVKALPLKFKNYDDFESEESDHYWNRFGASLTFFVISFLYIYEIVINPSEKTATDVHIIGSIMGIPFYFFILLKNSVLKNFQKEN